MSNAWLHTVLALWPLLLGAFVYVEISAYCAARKNFGVPLTIGALIFGLGLILQYATETSYYARQARPVAYFLVSAWTIVVPLAALTIGALLLGRARSAVWRQLGLFGLAAGVIAVFPLFALYSICASGVDCI